jgi:uncharacterized membrane protein
MRKFIRTTLIGGLVFLIPLVFVVVLVGKSFQILKVVATPLSKFLPPGAIFGMAPAVVLTAVIMTILCFLAGVLARSGLAQQFYAKLDDLLLQIIPGYAWAKGMTGSLSDEDAEAVLKPVLVRFDDQSQIGFEVDRTESNLVAVYLPSAPNAREGAVAFVEASRVEVLDTGLTSVAKSYKSLGRGSAAMLQGIGQ